MTDTLFELEDLTPDERVDPKSLRELLFAGLVATIEADAAAEMPDFIESEYLKDPDGTPRSGSAYWQAYERARGMRIALQRVRAALETNEEYLHADRERTRTTWSETERECARHRDVCPHCAAAGQTAWRTQREIDHLEQVRTIYVQGLSEVINALGRSERPLTVGQAQKALHRVHDAALRKWGAA